MSIFLVITLYTDLKPEGQLAKKEKKKNIQFSEKRGPRKVNVGSKSYAQDERLSMLRHQKSDPEWNAGSAALRVRPHIAELAAWKSKAE